MHHPTLRETRKRDPKTSSADLPLCRRKGQEFSPKKSRPFKAVSQKPHHARPCGPTAGKILTPMERREQQEADKQEGRQVNHQLIIRSQEGKHTTQHEGKQPGRQGRTTNNQT